MKKTIMVKYRKKGEMIPKKSVSMGVGNFMLKSRVRKLEQREEILVDKNEHQSVPDRHRPAERKQVWDP